LLAQELIQFFFSSCFFLPADPYCFNRLIVRPVGESRQLPPGLEEKNTSLNLFLPLVIF
jgi:hypothetical protein